MKTGKFLKLRTVFGPHVLNRHAVIYIPVAIVCALSFCFVYDLNHTAFSSLSYLSGHFYDFYEDAYANAGTLVYYPTIYVLFAFWNLPLILFGVDRIYPNNSFLLFYEKCFGYVFLIIIYVLVFRISKLILGHKESGVTAIIILSTIPCFFLCSLPFGLYDSIHVAFVMAGIYILMKKRFNKMAITSISCCIV